MLKDVNPYAQQYLRMADIIKEKPTENIKLVLRATGAAVDHRRYNLPSGTDVAVILPMTDSCATSGRDVVIYKTTADHPSAKSLMRIKSTHPMYDPLMYVLLFPFGDKGWEINFSSANVECTPLQYYKYRLMVRSDSFNPVHRMGRLFQQYIVDMYAKIEEQRLWFIRNNQNKLRTELYQGLADAVQSSDGEIDGTRIGKKIILPSSFTGSARYQH